MPADNNRNTPGSFYHDEEEERETMTGESPSEYSGPQAEQDGDHVSLDFKWESYTLSPEQAKQLGKDLQTEGKKAMSEEEY